MAIELNNVTSGYNISTINTNFQKLEDALNGSLVWRNGSAAGETLMGRDLDMNSHEILNVKIGTSPGSLVTKGYVDSQDQLLDNKISQEAAIRKAEDTALGSKVDKNFQRTLRVPEDSVNMLPPSAERRGKVQAYDSATGQPLLVPAEQLSVGDIVNLSSVDGFKYIGQVPSFAELRNIIPERLGQSIILTAHSEGWAAKNIAPKGGGVFLSMRLNGASDDGGHVCVPYNQNTYKWERMSTEVHLDDYGIEVIAESLLTPGNTEIDYAPMLQAAINRAKAINRPLVSSFNRRWAYSVPSAERKGIKIASFIDFSFLKRFNSVFPLIARFDETFTPYIDKGTGRQFAVKNMNSVFDSDGKKGFSTTQGCQDIGFIHIKNLADRSDEYPIEGIIHITSVSRFNDVQGAHNVNGTGVWLADTYDCTFTAGIMTEQCGNAKRWAQSMEAYPSSGRSDESNSNFIPYVMSHDDYDRLMYYRGTKLKIGIVHQERPHITTTEWNLPANATVDPTLSKYGYINNFFQLYDGEMGNFNGNNTDSTNNVGPVVSLHSMVNSRYNTLSSNYFDVFSGSFSDDDVSSIGTHVSGGFNVTARTKITIQSSNAREFRGAAGAVLPNEILLNGVYCNIDLLDSAGTLNMSGGTNYINYATVIGNANITGGFNAINLGTLNDIFTSVPISLGRISGKNLEHTGSANPGNFGVIDGAKFTGSVYLRNNAKQVIRNCEIVGTYNCSGTNHKSYVYDTTFGQSSFNITDGFFIVKGCKSTTSPAVWVLTNNIPAPGSECVNPYSGSAYRYKLTGWTEI